MRMRVLLCVLVLVASATTGCQFIDRVTGDFDGGPANGYAFLPAISADGRFVAFTSTSSDLVPGDTDGQADVFRRDVRTGATVAVSVDDAGHPVGAGGGEVDISDDGRHVVFVALAPLVAGDENDSVDVFVRDMVAGTTTRASAPFDGDPSGGGGGSGTGLGGVSISGDGHVVAFGSFATDLVPGDPSGTHDVYVRDLTAGTTVRASVHLATGADVQSYSEQPSLSADGRLLAFRSFAPDLVVGDDNDTADIFLRDLATDTTTVVSASVAGGVGHSDDVFGPNSVYPEISSDGRWVTFSSYATDLVPQPRAATSGVFVRDLQTSTTTLVSATLAGASSESTSFDPSISGDGRFVAFASTGDDLVGDPASTFTRVFVRDMVTGTTRVGSTDPFGRAANGDSEGVSLSGDGRYLAFGSRASNILQDHGRTTQSNGQDIYITAVTEPVVDSVAPASVTRGSSVVLTLTGSGFFGDAPWFGTTGDGVTVTGTERISDTELRVTVEIGSSAATGARSVIVWSDGTGAGPLATAYGVCVGCLTVS